MKEDGRRGLVIVVPAGARGGFRRLRRTRRPRRRQSPPPENPSEGGLRRASGALQRSGAQGVRGLPPSLFYERHPLRSGAGPCRSGPAPIFLFTPPRGSREASAIVQSVSNVGCDDAIRVRGLRREPRELCLRSEATAAPYHFPARRCLLALGSRHFLVARRFRRRRRQTPECRAR
jgi:hypothetical protein